jgi:hypothetical protein
MTAGAVPQPGVLEIRPVKPDGRLLPADNAVLAKWVIRADPAAGTLEFTEDRPLIITPARTVSFPLPSSGAPNALRAVRLVRHHWVKNLNSGITWQPVFLDGDGRVLACGRRRDEPRASQLWPARIFAPLQTLGITVTEESFDTEKLFKRAYPGA